MTFGLYPISELGILWLQATLSVVLVWFFVKTRLMPVVVATATVYTVTIMAWMMMVKFDVPTLWEMRISGREYPVMALGGLGIVTAYFVLKSMKRRRERKEAEIRASMMNAQLPAGLVQGPGSLDGAAAAPADRVSA